jgi:hypothetical protein
MNFEFKPENMEELMCCGNCAYHTTDNDGGAPYDYNYCNINNTSMQPNECCHNWDFDRMTPKQRLGK